MKNLCFNYSRISKTDFSGHCTDYPIAITFTGSEEEYKEHVKQIIYDYFDHDLVKVFFRKYIVIDIIRKESLYFAQVEFVEFMNLKLECQDICINQVIRQIKELINDYPQLANLEYEIFCNEIPWIEIAFQEKLEVIFQSHLTGLLGTEIFIIAMNSLKVDHDDIILAFNDAISEWNK